MIVPTVRGRLYLADQALLSIDYALIDSLWFSNEWNDLQTTNDPLPCIQSQNVRKIHATGPRHTHWVKRPFLFIRILALVTDLNC